MYALIRCFVSLYPNAVWQEILPSIVSTGWSYCFANE